MPIGRTRAINYRDKLILGSKRRVVGIAPGDGDPPSVFKLDDPGLSTNISHSGAGSFTGHSGAFRGGTTWQEVLWLPTGVDAVQICPLCDVADVSLWAGQRLSVQTTDGGVDLQNPWQGGTRLPMVPVTFNGAAGPTFAAASPDVPAGPWSDWMPVVNQGAGVCSLIIRQWAPGSLTGQNGSFQSNISVSDRYTVLAAMGLKAGLSFGGGNLTADNTAVMTATIYGMPILVRFATRRKVPSIWVYSDSVGQGFYGAGTVEATERWAISESLDGRPVAVSNRAETSQTSAKYFARLKAAVAAGDRCDVLVYTVASVNDAIAEDTIDKIINRAHQAIGLADQMGAAIVLRAPMPFSAGIPSAAYLAILNGAKQFCRDMADARTNLQVCSFDGLHDPNQYGRWVAAYNHQADAFHPNELGVYSVISPAMTAALKASLHR